MFSLRSWLAYVDDLVIAGSAQMVIQEAFTLKYVNFLTSENPVEFLGMLEQSNVSRTATSTWSSLRSSLMSCSGSLRYTGRVATTGLKLQALSEDQKAQCDKVIREKFRTAVGKLLWMAQLRYPIKELSRSLINPQDQDVKHLMHLLKCVSDQRLRLCHGASASCQESI